ncbi:MAG: hypothetical protein WC663_04250 [Patescibacteria group bacterium]|jgi:hypothetical protein
MKKKVLSLLCFLAIFFAFGMIANTNQAKAVTQTNESGKVTFADVVGDAKDYFGDRFIALDSNDYPHLCSYYEDGTYHGLKHAYWDGTAWQVEVVGRSLFVDFGKYCSIAIDKSNNNIWISFQSDSNLYVYKNTGGSWSSVWTADADGDTGYHTSIVLTSNGTPHVFYQKVFDAGTSYVKHAYLSGDSWITENAAVSGNNGWDISAVVDSSDNIHISYYRGSTAAIRYIQLHANGSWSLDVAVATTIALSHFLYKNNSISIGSDNVVRIGYFYYNGSTFCLKVAAGSVSGFTSESYTCNSTGIGGAPSIVLDSQNYSHISHSSYTSAYFLNYATNSSAGISDTVIESMDAGNTNTSMINGNENYFISDYSTGNDNQNLVLLDSVIPTATVALTGKAGAEFSYKMSASDYAKMGGAKYYCIDENDTCNPLTAGIGTALTSETFTDRIYPASSSTVKTIYFRVSDWAGNTISTALTESAAEEETGESERRTVTEDIIGQEIVNYDLVYTWKEVPNDPTRYWLQTFRYKKYNKKYPKYKSNTIKRYWKVRTNLYTYRKAYRKKLINAESNYADCYNSLSCSSAKLKTYKKKVVKYQNKMFKVRIKFYYTTKLVNKLRLKNSVLKKLTKKQAEKKLWLKIYDKGTKTWINANKLKLIANTKQKTKKNTFATDFRYFKQKDTLLTIGVK